MSVLTVVWCLCGFCWLGPSQAWILSSTARHSTALASQNTPNAAPSVDVSDLGLTMEDLEAPLPAEMFTTTSSGYESTSRLPSVDDQGCRWTEDRSTKRIQVQLTIPGLRGQPAAALAVEAATQTLTVTAFGYVVWSAILRGDIEPTSLQVVQVHEGDDRVPVIELSVEKTNAEPWGGFILQIGENSIL